MSPKDGMWDGVHVPDWDAQQRLIAQAEQMRAEAWSEIVDQVVSQPWRWLVAHIVQPLRTRARRRADIRALAALVPRLLADIGLTPTDVQALELGRIGLDDLGARRRGPRAGADVVDFPAVRSAEPAPRRHAA